MSTIDIHEHFFRSPDGSYSNSLTTIAAMVRRIDHFNNGELEDFLRGPRSTGRGRPRMMTRLEVLFARDLAKERGARSLRTGTYMQLIEEFYAPGATIPSLSTVSRTLRIRTPTGIRETRKRLQRIHRDRDYAKINQFLQRVAPFDHRRFVDIDEVSQSRADFLQRHGYAPEGEEAIHIQIKIGTRTFSTIAAMGYSGFIAWKIFEDNLNHTHVADFVRNDLAPYIMPGQRGLVDNAGSHHHHDVYAALNLAFAGVWFFASPYSPHLKPIERGFALIKAFIKFHEDEALEDPVEWINRAFNEYSVGGPKGDSCRGFWNVYERLHESFLAGRI
jgi:transposase